jgi:hypothetical protein
MKRLLLPLFLLISLFSQSQNVFGYWYGYASTKSKGSANNYLVELILQPEKGYVRGILNYYFKNSYRSIEVKGNYNAATRQVTLYDIPVVYHGSHAKMEVDCIMTFQGKLKTSRTGSAITGAFVGMPDYKYTCTDINFNLSLNADISKKDSVLTAIREFKESSQLWQPSYTDTLVAATVIPRKVINYVTESAYTKRENIVIQEIEVESDSVGIDVYDNGEIDGDMISVFYNNQLILNNQKLTHRAIHMDLKVDDSKTTEISMFAENLGLIPPNTALMIIHDGEKRHEVRLTSSMEKNATIRIKRKK